MQSNSSNKSRQPVTLQTFFTKVHDEALANEQSGLGRVETNAGSQFSFQSLFGTQEVQTYTVQFVAKRARGIEELSENFALAFVDNLHIHLKHTA